MRSGLLPRRLPPSVYLAFWAVAVLLLGFLLGAAWGLSRLSRQTPITLQPDTRPRFGVVRIEGIRDGALLGTLSGDVRLFAGDRLVLVGSGGHFRIADRSLLTNTVTVHAPEGMPFIASRRGQKYYRVGSPDGDRIVPENRVYFESRGDAERAGYVPDRP